MVLLAIKYASNVVTGLLYKWAWTFIWQVTSYLDCSLIILLLLEASLWSDNPNTMSLAKYVAEAKPS